MTRHQKRRFFQERAINEPRLGDCGEPGCRVGLYTAHEVAIELCHLHNPEGGHQQKMEEVRARPLCAGEDCKRRLHRSRERRAGYCRTCDPSWVRCRGILSTHHRKRPGQRCQVGWAKRGKNATREYCREHEDQAVGLPIET